MNPRDERQALPDAVQKEIRTWSGPFGIDVLSNDSARKALTRRVSGLRPRVYSRARFKIQGRRSGGLADQALQGGVASLEKHSGAGILAVRLPESSQFGRAKGRL
jgi:hypothetical protein